jgi:uncharacterized caspase-like protein
MKRLINEKYNLKIFQCLEFREVLFMKLIKIFFAISITFLLWFQAELFSQTADELSKQRGNHLVVLNKETGKGEIVNLYNKVYGVVVGIDLYKNFSSVQPLRYAVRDAKGMEKLLIERFIFDKIFTLYNSEATKERIMALLLGKLSQIDPDDAVFIFFAGHGHTEATKYGELGYLLPYDGSFKKNELHKNISMTQLKEDVSKQIPAKHVFYMVDACYSGLLVKRGRGVDTSRDLNYLRKITRETARQVLTAGGMGEEVLDGGPFGHSVFVGRIIQILKETSDYITAKELYIQVREKVFSDANAMGHIQTPAFGKFFGLGDFVFVPRSDRRYREVQAEIEKIKSQLEEIKRQTEKLKKLKKKKEIRDFERKAEELRVQLKAREVAQERLKKEKERKKRLEEEVKRIAQEEAQKKAEMERQQAVRDIQLKQLRQKFIEEEAQLKDLKSKVLSIEEARKEVVLLESKIETITSQITTKKEKALTQLKRDYDLIIKKLKKMPTLPKGQFETTANYEERQNSHLGKIEKIENRYNTEYRNVQKGYDNDIEERTKIYRIQIDELENRKYPVEGLEIQLHKYDPDKELYRVKLNDNRSNNWYYSISTKPDIARELFERKEILNAECYYKGLKNDKFLGEGFVINQKLGKLQLITGIKLRSNHIIINYEDIKSMIKKKGFFDSKTNPTAEFNNQFELVINNRNDKVVLDYATGLMWHQSGSSRFFRVFSGTLKTANAWVKRLNKKRYAGYDDWRLPTVEEALSLLENSKNNGGRYRNLIFHADQDLIWTGDKGKSEDRWLISFVYGTVYWSRRGAVKNSYIRPVRSMQ